MITRHDNGDGTTTFMGVSVTIPTSVATTHDVAAVRVPLEGDVIELHGSAKTAGPGERTTYTILALRPAWKPPAFVAVGIYRWVGKCLFANDGAALWGGRCIRSVYREMTEPSCEGRWRVNEDGTATYLGDK